MPTLSTEGSGSRKRKRSIETPAVAGEKPLLSQFENPHHVQEARQFIQNALTEGGLHCRLPIERRSVLENALSFVNQISQSAQASAAEGGEGIDEYAGVGPPDPEYPPPEIIHMLLGSEYLELYSSFG